MLRVVRSRTQRHRRYRWEKWLRAFARLRASVVSARRQIVVVSSLAIACLIPIALVALFFSPVLRVTSISVTRSDLRIDLLAVQRALAPILGRRLPFVTAQQVEEFLTPRVHDLLEVSVEKRYPSELGVRLTLDPIVARLQIDDGSTEEATATGALLDYLTRQGTYVRYARGQVRDDGRLPVLKVIDWAARPNVGTRPFDAELLERLPEAEAALLDQFEQRVTERTIFIRAREFHLRTPAHELWFDLASPLSVQLARYRLFLQTFGLSGATQYVDLRPVDRVVYQ